MTTVWRKRSSHYLSVSTFSPSVHLAPVAGYVPEESCLAFTKSDHATIIWVVTTLAAEELPAKHISAGKKSCHYVFKIRLTFLYFIIFCVTKLCCVYVWALVLLLILLNDKPPKKLHILINYPWELTCYNFIRLTHFGKGCTCPLWAVCSRHSRYLGCSGWSSSHCQPQHLMKGWITCEYKLTNTMLGIRVLLS